jgi:NAD(P)H-dependent flavin oxidoreductase YrpB (nitropropane dioxygenase family)
VPDWYKDKLVGATDTSTVRNRWFTGKTTRHIGSEWDRQCDASGLEALPMPEQGILVTPMTIGAAQAGRYEDSGIYCGQGAARITEVLPAATIIKEMIESATEILSRELPTRVSFG